MNPQAKEVIDIAASELGRVADAAEVRADLARQGAELLRRGDVAQAVQTIVAMLRVEGGNPGLVTRLIATLESRDPDLWREMLERTQELAVDELPLDRDLLTLAGDAHAVICRHGESCRVLSRIRERLRGA